MIDKSKGFIIAITTFILQIICKSAESKAFSLFQTDFLSRSNQSFLINETSNVTVVVITCCERYDYLVKTLTSFA